MSVKLGGIYYSNDANVRAMLTALFPSFEGEAVSTLKGI